MIIDSSRFNEKYSEILNKYIELVVDEGGRAYTDNPSLKRRINGILNIRKRYAPLLHKKLEIFYSELTGYAQKNGRFKKCFAGSTTDFTHAANRVVRV